MSFINITLVSASLPPPSTTWATVLLAVGLSICWIVSATAIRLHRLDMCLSKMEHDARQLALHPNEELAVLSVLLRRYINASPNASDLLIHRHRQQYRSLLTMGAYMVGAEISPGEVAILIVWMLCRCRAVKQLASEVEGLWEIWEVRPH